jgi:hypothetical protein
LGFAVKAAWFTDVTEKERLDNITLKDSGKSLSFEVPSCGFRTIGVELA